MYSDTDKHLMTTVIVSHRRFCKTRGFQAFWEAVKSGDERVSQHSSNVMKVASTSFPETHDWCWEDLPRKKGITYINASITQALASKRGKYIRYTPVDTNGQRITAFCFHQYQDCVMLYMDGETGKVAKWCGK